ncbi:MAG: STN domain-containing protein [Armatimonadota bacterium]|nr:MAG: STN domain-containing protein [Armatimonadota bacterium]
MATVRALGLLIVAVAVAHLLLVPPAWAQERRITLSFEDVAAADAVIQFRWLAEVPIVFQPPANDVRINLVMQEVPLEQALDALCRQMSYEWRKVGQVYVLRPAQRAPLLPAPEDLANRVLYSERQRLDAARLMLTLTQSQIARASQGDALAYGDLSQPQQELLGGIFGRLISAVRGGWLPGARALEGSPSEPPESLAFSIRGYVWRLEGPQPAAERPTVLQTPEEAPQPIE